MSCVRSSSPDCESISESCSRRRWFDTIVPWIEGTYYLAGYAVECALKACIAKETKRHEFPDRRKVDASHTHDLRELVRLAKLEKSRRGSVKSRSGIRQELG